MLNGLVKETIWPVIRPDSATIAVRADDTHRRYADQRPLFMPRQLARRLMFRCSEIGLASRTHRWPCHACHRRRRTPPCCPACLQVDIAVVRAAMKRASDKEKACRRDHAIPTVTPAWSPGKDETCVQMGVFRRGDAAMVKVPFRWRARWRRQSNRQPRSQAGQVGPVVGRVNVSPLEPWPKATCPGNRRAGSKEVHFLGDDVGRLRAFQYVLTGYTDITRAQRSLGRRPRGVLPRR